MNDERKELIMAVDGIARAGGVEAVTKAVRRLDPSAEVEVDLTHGRITVATCAQALEVAEALGKAGEKATAMTPRGGAPPYSPLVPRNPAAPRSATKRSVIVGQKP